MIKRTCGTCHKEIEQLEDGREFDGGWYHLDVCVKRAFAAVADELGKRGFLPGDTVNVILPGSSPKTQTLEAVVLVKFVRKYTDWAQDWEVRYLDDCTAEVPWARSVQMNYLIRRVSRPQVIPVALV